MRVKTYNLKKPHNNNNKTDRQTEISAKMPHLVSVQYPGFSSMLKFMKTNQIKGVDMMSGSSWTGKGRDPLKV